MQQKIKPHHISKYKTPFRPLSLPVPLPSDQVKKRPRLSLRKIKKAQQSFSHFYLSPYSPLSSNSLLHSSSLIPPYSSLGPTPPGIDPRFSATSSRTALPALSDENIPLLLTSPNQSFFPSFLSMQMPSDSDSAQFHKKSPYAYGLSFTHSSQLPSDSQYSALSPTSSPAPSPGPSASVPLSGLSFTPLLSSPVPPPPSSQTPFKGSDIDNYFQHLRLRKPLARQLSKANIVSELIISHPLWVRIFHWGFALSMIVIVLTGLNLHKPVSYFHIRHSDLLIIHISAGFCSFGFLSLRIADMLIRHDKSLFPTKRDIKNIPKFFSYYFFARNTLPPGGKYNVGAKITFLSWFIVTIIAGTLGLLSYWEGKYLTWLLHWLGGFQVTHWIKYFAAIYVGSTIILHIYLVLSHDLSKLQAMITGYEHKNRHKNKC